MSNEEQNKFIKKIIKENVHTDLVTIYFLWHKKGFYKKKDFCEKKMCKKKYCEKKFLAQ